MMSKSPWLAGLFLLIGCPTLPAGDAGMPRSIPFHELGKEAEKLQPAKLPQIYTTPAGVHLRAELQDLEAVVTGSGLWIKSTTEEDTGMTPHFRVRAMGVRRGSAEETLLSPAGHVSADCDSSKVSYVRPELIEEYSTSVDGVRQDFVLLQRPSGRMAPLEVRLDVTGAQVEKADYGAKLTLPSTGRELGYCRLKVTDATGSELPAWMTVANDHTLTIQVDDSQATYPVRIDPTFSDADWISMGTGPPGLSGEVFALAVDGTGNLYVGGSFTATASGATVNHIAKWNGSSWLPLGAGVNDTVKSIVISGTTVYAGGLFTEAGSVSAIGVARWNGSSWSALGEVNGFVNSLALNGSVLYAAGYFISLGDGIPCNIARWNGSTWSNIGDTGSGTVEVLLMNGSTLYAGGGFTAIETGVGVVPANAIATYNGTTWSPLGAGIGNNGTVYAIAVSGANVYAAGSFDLAGSANANNVARWNGSAWSALGGPSNNGVNTEVRALAVSGSSLYVGGNFSEAGGISVSNVALWNGSAWSPMGSGFNLFVNALLVSGSNVYAGGSFDASGTITANNVARWTGSAWSGMGTGLDGAVHALAVSGTTLYLGGHFVSAGSLNVNHIVKWNGSAFSVLGDGLDADVNALVANGPDLYAGGVFSQAGGVAASRVAKWNGTTWSALGDGINGSVSSLAMNSGILYVGGTFTMAGSTNANNIAAWDGADWSALGSGLEDTGTVAVRALAASSDGIYAAGHFATAGGIAAENIAQWDGTAWSSLGSGISGAGIGVRALLVDGGLLYVGGEFTTAGGIAVSNIASWNGSGWQAMGEGLDDDVWSLTMIGSAIFAGGDFTVSGASSVNCVARWDGYEWTGLGSGADSTVRALAAVGTVLYAGGDFITAGGKSSTFAARAKAGFPSVVAGEVKLLTPTSVNITGTVNPQGTATTVQIEYGPTDAYGSTTSVILSPNTGTVARVVNKTLTGLVAGAEYHYRFKTINATGTSYTSDATFTIPEGTLAFDPSAATLVVLESDGVVNVPVIRTGGTLGSVSASLATVNGTAVSPADYAAVNQPNFTMTSGQSTYLLPITIENPGSTPENNETFTVKLTGPFVTPGGLSTVTVRIIDSALVTTAGDNVRPPAPVITAPAANATVTVATGGTLSVTGTATDNKGVKRVRVRVTTGGLPDSFTQDAVLAAPGATSTGFTAQITPNTGINTVEVIATDYADNETDPLKPAVRTFKVLRLLDVDVLSNTYGSVTTGFSPSSGREAGKSYTITATQKAPSASFSGGIFTGWTISGTDEANKPAMFANSSSAARARLGITENALEKNTLTFIYREGLKLTANFAPNPYSSAIVGSYNGLIKASTSAPTVDGTAPGNSTEGFFTATVQNTGAFSGKLTIDGLVLNVAGVFDAQGVARFGTSRATTVTVARTGKPSLIVKFNIGPVDSLVPAGRITGEVTATEFLKSSIAAVSKVQADRAYFNGLAGGNIVPDDYLTVTGTAASPTGRTDGYFTVVLPSLPIGSQPTRITDEGYTEMDYPQGDGVGAIKVSKAGVVSLTATLADGTILTASSTLSQELEVPLFAQLYNKLGFFSTRLKLDKTESDSDMKAAGGAEAIWGRPSIFTSHYYPYGWAEVLDVGIQGARYTARAGESSFRAPDTGDAENDGDKLGAPNADGNVTLTFSDGLLSDTLTKTANISTTDAVVKVPDNDPTFTLKFTRTTGALDGTLTHTDDTVIPFKAMTYQKGPGAGGYGYFLTKQPVPINYTGESGGVTLMGDSD